MISYHKLLKLNISMNLKFQKTKTDASVVINVFFKRYIYLSVFPNYFHQSNQFYQNNCTIYIVIFYGAFFEMFVFTCWFCFYFLFSFVSISGQSFMSSSKDLTATTATVELIIRTVIVLLTFKIVYYSRKLSVQ